VIYNFFALIFCLKRIILLVARLFGKAGKMRLNGLHVHDKQDSVGFVYLYYAIYPEKIK